jgi:hypothetical protein
MSTLHDRRLLVGQNLIVIFDLANIEAIARHIEKGSASERKTAAGRTGGEQPAFLVRIS